MEKVTCRFRIQGPSVCWWHDTQFYSPTQSFHFSHGRIVWERPLYHIPVTQPCHFPQVKKTEMELGAFPMHGGSPETTEPCTMKVLATEEGAYMCRTVSLLQTSIGKCVERGRAMWQGCHGRSEANQRTPVLEPHIMRVYLIGMKITQRRTPEGGSL